MDCWRGKIVKKYNPVYLEYAKNLENIVVLELQIVPIGKDVSMFFRSPVMRLSIAMT